MPAKLPPLNTVLNVVRAQYDALVKLGECPVPWEQHEKYVRALYKQITEMDQDKQEEFIENRAEHGVARLKAQKAQLDKVIAADAARRVFDEAAKEAKAQHDWNKKRKKAAK